VVRIGSVRPPPVRALPGASSACTTGGCLDAQRRRVLPSGRLYRNDEGGGGAPRAATPLYRGSHPEDRRSRRTEPAASRVPSESGDRAGGLMVYQANQPDIYRCLSFYVDKILTGGSRAIFPWSSRPSSTWSSTSRPPTPSGCGDRRLCGDSQDRKHGAVHGGVRHHRDGQGRDSRASLPESVRHQRGDLQCSRPVERLHELGGDPEPGGRGGLTSPRPGRRRNHPTGRRRSEISGGSRLFLCGDSGQFFLQPPNSRERRARLATRRAGWIWSCTFEGAPGNTAPRATGHSATSQGTSHLRWLRASLKGGKAREFDRVPGRRGRYRWRRAEDAGRLLGRGSARASVGFLMHHNWLKGAHT